MTGAKWFTTRWWEQGWLPEVTETAACITDGHCECSYLDSGVVYEGVVFSRHELFPTREEAVAKVRELQRARDLRLREERDQNSRVLAWETWYCIHPLVYVAEGVEAAFDVDDDMVAVRFPDDDLRMPPFRFTPGYDCFPTRAEAEAALATLRAQRTEV